MSTVTIALPDALDAALTRQMEADGVQSKESYLLQVIEDYFAQSALEGVLLDRDQGPFIPLDPDWKEQVMRTALQRLQA